MDYAQLTTTSGGWELEAGEYTFTLNAYKAITTTDEDGAATTDYKKDLGVDEKQTGAFAAEIFI